jgi:hypothetical protein
MIKVPVVNRVDYTMYLEPCADMLWFHTDVRKWTPEIKKEYLKDLETLQSLVAIPLAALVEENNIKLAKFGRSIGWIKINQLNVNDKKYDVYTRSETWVTL